MPRRPDEDGFTLIETLVVLVLIAFTMVATPAILGSLSGVRLRAAADQMIGLLRETRLKAVQGGLTVSVFVDPVRRLYVVTPGTGTAPLPPVIGAVSIEPANRPGADPVARIDFFADGSASATRLSLHHGTRIAGITIDRPTGRVGRD